MLFKSKGQKIYTGIIKQIACVMNTPGRGVEMLFTDFTEKIVFVYKDPMYNGFNDIFTEEPYYGTKDLSLKPGDYALLYANPIKEHKKVSKDVLKKVCDEMNLKLENLKNDTSAYKSYVKSFKSKN